MTPRVRVAAVLAFIGCVGGCATPSSTDPSVVVTTVRPKVIAAERARGAIVVGRSTATDVLAALGETQSIIFDSGYEVWVYRLSDSAADAPVGERIARAFSPRYLRDTTAELVILFAPTGIVAKSRVRPATQGR